jgi:hypothetical protein
MWNEKAWVGRYLLNAGMAALMLIASGGSRSAYSEDTSPTGDAPLEGKISACFHLKDNQKRLDCYDTSIQHEVDKYKAHQDVVRQEWQGNGLQTTRPFNMPGSWEFQWDSKGFFQVMLYHKGESSGETMPNIIANQTNSGRGNSYVDKGGDYYLVVNALGPWKARAVLISDSK